MNAIVMENVKRSFGKKQVLNGVSGSIAEGRVVGLLGRNGEGKTTLFRILLDLLEADSGRAEILGHKPDGSGLIRQKIGYIPEKPVFHDFMTVREVFLWRSRFFKNWDAKKAEALARQLELDLNTKIAGSSKGTLGKIAWVCAAAHQPALFLLDEPTSGLDALIREEILGQLITELHASGKTILVANHRMEELAGVLNEVWVLADGRIAGIYDMDHLRKEACRITGRRREGTPLPADLPIVELNTTGPIVEWAALDKSTVNRVVASDALDHFEMTPLPIATSLRLLLRHHDPTQVETVA